MDARRHRSGALASAAAASLWVILAWRSPTSTHHFAPLVAAGVWGYLSRLDRVPNPSRPDRLVMFVGGFGFAATAQIILTIADKLDGPPLISAIPVPLELLLMGALGAIIGGGRPPPTRSASP